MSELSPSNQAHWADIIEHSVFNIEGVAKRFEVNAAQLRRYLHLKVQPRKNNQERLEKIMSTLTSMPRQKKHPSYGYATLAEIEQLNRMGMGPERDRILKDIEKRTRLQGKQRG